MAKSQNTGEANASVTFESGSHRTTFRASGKYRRHPAFFGIPTSAVEGSPAHRIHKLRMENPTAFAAEEAARVERVTEKREATRRAMASMPSRRQLTQRNAV